MLASVRSLSASPHESLEKYMRSLSAEELQFAQALTSAYSSDPYALNRALAHAEAAGMKLDLLLNAQINRGLWGNFWYGVGTLLWNADRSFVRKRVSLLGLKALALSRQVEIVSGLYGPAGFDEGQIGAHRGASAIACLQQWNRWMEDYEKDESTRVEPVPGRNYYREYVDYKQINDMEKKRLEANARYLAGLRAAGYTVPADCPLLV
jgi:hypothetical protein